MGPLQVALFWTMVAMTYVTVQVDIMKNPVARQPTTTAATLITPTLASTTPLATTTISTTSTWTPFPLPQDYPKAYQQVEYNGAYRRVRVMMPTGSIVQVRIQAWYSLNEADTSYWESL